jgi:hypothetical protein
MTCRPQRERNVLYRTLILTAITATSLAPALAAELSVVNASDVPLQHLYISSCDAKQWSADQFAEALPPSRLATVTDIVPGCYDIKVVVVPWNSCVIAGATLRGSSVWKVTRWTVFGSQSGDCSHIAGYAPVRRRAWVGPSAATSVMGRD